MTRAVGTVPGAFLRVDQGDVLMIYSCDPYRDLHYRSGSLFPKTGVKKFMKPL